MSSGVTICSAAPQPPDPNGLAALYTVVSTASASTDHLIETHLPMARKMAADLHRRAPARVGLDELESDAVYALAEAARRFDASRGVTFQAYAARCIRHAMWRMLKQRHRSAGTASLDGDEQASAALSNQIADDAPGPEHIVEVRQQVQCLLEHLQPRLRCVAQGLLDGLTREQIAEQLGIARSTVFARINEIRDVAQALGIR
ncbi:MAG TPA: sigma-70 family RNA polymerase sigma factor [Candidatus Omnitrophota bacterium]|nr:sigma-70 family RNA polymerase sigma factor [Candidatus Omnitrophota bacterium]